jgi:hypothetical protein
MRWLDALELRLARKIRPRLRSYLYEAHDPDECLRAGGHIYGAGAVCLMCHLRAPVND